jgi:7-cyano-7-deazaguanine reductase
MTNLYQVKDFSKLTGVTARTLQYYDEIGLLKPHQKTEAGYRLYSEDDLLTLQQITTLKFMGFNLKQIKVVISNKKFDIEKSLQYQGEVLATEADRLNKASRLIKQAHRMLEEDGKIDWQSITKIIEVLKMTDQNKANWVKDYFNEAELKEFEELGNKYSPEQMQEYGKKWEAMFNEVKQNLPLNPASEKAQILLQKWLALVDEVYGNVPAIRKKMWDAFKTGMVPKDNMPYYDQSVVDFIDEATTYFKKTKD